MDYHIMIHEKKHLEAMLKCPRYAVNADGFYMKYGVFLNPIKCSKMSMDALAFCVFGMLFFIDRVS